MEIQIITFNAFDEFATYIDERKDDKIRLYRGQKEDWPLDSKLFRLVKESRQIKDIYKIEKRIFNKFKVRFKEYFKTSKDLNDWEILSIGQHFGLPTRLIDWSSNPLIALWFAFESEKENDNDRVLWGLVVEKESLVNFEKDNLFGGRFVKVFQPHSLDNRIRNQESWFSIQTFEIFGQGGDGLLAFNNYNTLNENHYFEYYLVKFIFKNTMRMDILEEIGKLGVNFLKVFPDLEGLSKMIEWSEIRKNYPQQAL